MDIAHENGPGQRFRQDRRARRNVHRSRRQPGRPTRRPLRRLTVEIDELATAITSHTTPLAPSLLAIPGCTALTATKIIGETTGIDRFRSKDDFARHIGTGPVPMWSSNRARPRLSRNGNRQLNAAPRIALTQIRCHADARALLARRKADDDGGMEALRILKRRLSDVVFRAMVANQSSLMNFAA